MIITSAKNPCAEIPTTVTLAKKVKKIYNVRIILTRFTALYGSYTLGLVVYKLSRILSRYKYIYVVSEQDSYILKIMKTLVRTFLVLLLVENLLWKVKSQGIYIYIYIQFVKGDLYM